MALGQAVLTIAEVGDDAEFAAEGTDTGTQSREGDAVEFAPFEGGDARLGFIDPAGTEPPPGPEPGL